MYFVEPITTPKALTELYQLRLSAYQVEADLLGVPTLPPLQRSLDELLAEKAKHFGIRQDEHLVGGISIEDDWINSLVVDPSKFRQGIAYALLAFVLPKQPTWLVSTGVDNLPAINLYQKHGFIEQRRFEVPGLQLIELRHCK